MKTKITVVFASMGLLATASVCAETSVLKNKGSDTMLHLAQAWAESFHQQQPGMTIDVRGCGSSTGITALINGTVDLANVSRGMKNKELAEAKKNGVSPVEHVVAHDALAVFVHKNNPLDWISVKNLAEVYGEGGTIEDWGKLGVTVPGCVGNKVALVGRQVNSGTQVFFQETILGDKRDFKHNADSKDVDDTDEVVDLIETNVCAIGYGGMAYDSAKVKKLKVAKDYGSAVIEANVTNAVNGTYPLARPLYMISDGPPKGQVKTYLDWILSDSGQCVVVNKGYAPVRPVQCK